MTKRVGSWTRLCKPSYLPAQKLKALNIELNFVALHCLCEGNIHEQDDYQYIINQLISVFNNVALAQIYIVHVK